MKKIIRSFTLIGIISVMCSICFFASAVGEPRFEVSSAEGKIGDQITIDVSIVDSPSFGGMTYEMKYDNVALELISYEKKLGGDYCVSSAVDTYPDKMSFIYAGLANITGDGVLVTLTFRIKDTAPVGDTAVSIIPEDGTLYYYDGQTEIDFTMDSAEGAVTILENELSYTAPVLSDKLSMKVTGSYGIRVLATVTPEQRSYAKEYGYIVTKATDAGADGPTFDDARYANGVAYKADGSTDIQYAVHTNGDIDFTGLMINIPLSERTTELCVRTYIKIDINGESKTFYGDTMTVTLRGAAAALKASAVYESLTEEEKALVNTLAA